MHTWSPESIAGRPAASIRRRAWLAGALLGAVPAFAAGPGGAQAGAPRLAWPRDFGSHLESRLEWWYITAHTRVGEGAQGRDLGFQLTFFRNRVEQAQAMASKFAPRQLLFAHAAVSDVRARRFWHDQRIARAGFGVAQASEADTDVRLRDWSLVRQDGHYRARLPAGEFALDIRFDETQPLLLQGEQGLSRKGADARQTSHYYSKPQLAFDGTVTLQGERIAVRGDGARVPFDPLRPGGAAWLDHEWSDSFLAPAAVGWDWVGINLFDGSALTAFRLRDAAGSALWDGGSFRRPSPYGSAGAAIFARGEVEFQALRHWTSAATRANYPVEWRLQVPSGDYLVRAVLDNQELDSRASTGTIYWEGLCDLLDGQRRPVGRGYLEMTGYAKPLVL